MENLQTIGRTALIACLASLLCACSTPALPPATVPRASALPAPRFDISQVGSGQSTRYVYCDVPSCPMPSVKTAVLPAPTTTHSHPLTTGLRDKRDMQLTVDIGFPFNSSRMSSADRRLLSTTPHAHPYSHVEITARSDFVGPRAGQHAVIAARARAMRSIVAHQAPGAQIIERQEVAAPRPVARAEQAMQRRGSVRFTSPADVHMKGNIK